ncbi:hypothetical protein KR038_003229 [Drosophila bunnanda]|nr:hypothetical protein KR038_003229 [Drosophila bunnanda]
MESKCYLQVNAVVVPYPSVDASPELADLTDLTDGQATEDLRIFSAPYKAIKLALRSIKGLNCVLKWVAGIQDSATSFNRNVVGCGVTASQDLTNLINANVQIVNTCSSLVNQKSGVCADTDAEGSTISNSCFAKTLAGVWNLNKQVKAAIKLAGKLPKTGPNAVACVNDAVSTLVTYYTAFPQNMVTCSKLTS